MSEKLVTSERGYKIARFLHWFTAAIFIVMLIATYFAAQWASNSSERALVYYWHMSFGVLFLYLLTFRYFGAFVLPTTRTHFDSRVQAIMARTNHWFLYTLMIIVPTSGLFFTLADGDPVPFFKLFTLEPGEWLIHEDAGYYLGELHIWLKWPCLVLLVLHSLGAMTHWLMGVLKAKRHSGIGSHADS
ncbi:cytochrome b [Motiliproteus sediminis]|uniref:cytochrome b n=1 Tax=Motiliproteus sediminis TaxID=1468178 RepID=UPI001AEF9277